jgi:hypothetical protein
MNIYITSSFFFSSQTRYVIFRVPTHTWLRDNVHLEYDTELHEINRAGL